MKLAGRLTNIKLNVEHSESNVVLNIEIMSRTSSTVGDWEPRAVEPARWGVRN